jgi:hypothetical protein
VKTGRYNPFVLERELREACVRANGGGGDVARPNRYVRTWYAPQAVADLLAFRRLVDDYEYADVLRVVLARAARSARLTTHFELDFPRRPQRAPYWCHKHRRQCRPVEQARHFLERYALDTVARIRAFARVRRPGCDAVVLHGDARELRFGEGYDGILTSPPYPGLIDYHEQHRYAYELLGLEDLRAREVGRAARGTTAGALDEYADGIVAALVNACASLRPRAPVVIVVHDRRDLFPEILARAGLVLEQRLRRHVNRRTGRRAGEFFEDILVARAP